VNLHKSQSPAHGLGRASCACLSKNSTISSSLHFLFNLFNSSGYLQFWCLCLLFSLFLPASIWAAGQGSSAQTASGISSSLSASQKFRIGEPELAQEAIANGADFIADYGSFQVFRANGELARKLAKDPNAEDLSA